MRVSVKETQSNWCVLSWLLLLFCVIFRLHHPDSAFQLNSPHGKREMLSNHLSTYPSNHWAAHTHRPLSIDGARWGGNNTRQANVFGVLKEWHTNSNYEASYDSFFQVVWSVVVQSSFNPLSTISQTRVLLTSRVVKSNRVHHVSPQRWIITIVRFKRLEVS